MSRLTDWQGMLNKYNTLVESGRFKESTDSEKEIVALKAAVKPIKDTNVKLSAKIGKRRSGKENNPSGANKRSKNGKRSFNHNKWKDLNPNKIPKVWTGSKAWKSTPPKPNGKKEKVVNGKMYCWCKDHKVWTLYHPDKCKWRLDRITKKSIAKEAVVDTPKEEAADTIACVSIMEDATPDKALLYKRKAKATFEQIRDIQQDEK